MRKDTCKEPTRHLTTATRHPATATRHPSCTEPRDMPLCGHPCVKSDVCGVLCDTAALCNTLQRTATHCNALQRTATHCNVLQRTATHCNALQRTATHCNTCKEPIKTMKRLVKSHGTWMFITARCSTGVAIHLSFFHVRKCH